MQKRPQPCEGAQRTPQFLSVFVVAVPALALLVAGLVLGARPAGRRPRLGGLGLTLATTALVVALWFV